MRILLAGGGSGGHVTPLRAISQSLKTKKPDVQITVISDRAFFNQTQFLFSNEDNVKLKKIFSGKFRRYNSKSLLWHMTHLPTVSKNTRDVFYIGLGLIQSFKYFLFNRPDVVFCKGGYVCVPVGVVARLFNVPIIIHDSDTHAGLTNRLIAPWSVKIATGMPSKYYAYPSEKMVYSGIPVSRDFKPVASKERTQAVRDFDLDPTIPVVFVTGGGTGAKELNTAVIKIADKLLEHGWQILHLTGKNKSGPALKARQRLSAVAQKKWNVQEFAELMPYVQAADIIVTRAGATAMQEFANAKKTTVIVPSPHLTGGHQLKNATMFEENNAACVVHEAQIIDNPAVLLKTLEDLYEQTHKSDALASNLHKKFAKPTAADEIASLILDTTSS